MMIERIDLYRMTHTPFDKLPSDGGYGGVRISGKHLSLTATGDGTKGADGYANNGDINIQGSNVSATVVDLNAAAKYPGSNSGSQWTVQIKVNKQLLGSDGQLYDKAINLTHIPLGN